MRTPCLLSERGRHPESLFPLKAMSVSALRLASSAGIDPDSWFRARLRCWSADSRPRSAGIRPLSPSRCRSSRVTRCSRRCTLTPSHRVIGVPTAQLSLSDLSSALLLAISALQSATRPALEEFGVATEPVQGDVLAIAGMAMTSATPMAASAPSAAMVRISMRRMSPLGWGHGGGSARIWREHKRSRAVCQGGAWGAGRRGRRGGGRSWRASASRSRPRGGGRRRRSRGGWSRGLAGGAASGGCG